jgi:transcription antitermination factor NusA-like protein
VIGPTPTRDVARRPRHPQGAGRSVHAMHIVASRSNLARAISTQGHNVRLAIWLAGWHIEVCDEFGERPHRCGAR